MRWSAGLDGHAPTRMSGGSAANTLIAVQGFGASTFYSCKVADDETGRHFLDDLTDAGVVTNANAASESGKVRPLPGADHTGCGALDEHLPGYIQRSDSPGVGRSRTQQIPVFLRRRLHELGGWQPTGRNHVGRDMAEKAGVKTALSLSDPSMVEFFRDALVEILGNGVDHLFCNEEEALTWAGTDRIDVAVAELKDIGRNLNITLGAKGSLAVTPGGQSMVPQVSLPMQSIPPAPATCTPGAACTAGARGCPRRRQPGSVTTPLPPWSRNWAPGSGTGRHYLKTLGAYRAGR